MKSIFLFSFILALGYSISFAQHRVTVMQQGNGNKATIIQGDNGSSKKQQKVQISCEEEQKKSGPGNSITVKSSGKTVIDTTGHTKNRYQGTIDGKNELSAFQYGRGNNLSLLLPDPAAANNILAAYQNGSGNMLAAILNNSYDNLNVSQSGSGNSITINPCRSKADTSYYFTNSISR